jgi:hypothetical protein
MIHPRVTAVFCRCCFRLSMAIITPLVHCHYLVIVFEKCRTGLLADLLLRQMCLATRPTTTRLSCGCALALYFVAGNLSTVFAQQASQEAATRQSEARPADLASVDQLVLVLSNATDPKGNRQEVLVFLGRTKNRGWETVGVTDSDELSQHWRSVAKRQLEPYHQAGLTTEQLDKVNLAVEVSIAQFQRLYYELRNDFLDQPDQKSRLAVLANDNRYERLRKLGREGLFVDDSLVAKVVNKVLADSNGPPE